MISELLREQRWLGPLRRPSWMFLISCVACFLFFSIENCSCGNCESSTVFSICLVLMFFFFAVACSGTNPTVLLRDSLFQELQLTLVWTSSVRGAEDFKAVRLPFPMALVTSTEATNHWVEREM